MHLCSCTLLFSCSVNSLLTKLNLFPIIFYFALPFIFIVLDVSLLSPHTSNNVWALCGRKSTKCSFLSLCKQWFNWLNQASSCYAVKQAEVIDSGKKEMSENAQNPNYFIDNTSARGFTWGLKWSGTGSEGRHRLDTLGGEGRWDAGAAH